MKKIYLTGQINRSSPKTIARSVEELQLISRRIFLAKCIAVSPVLWFVNFDSDPRMRRGTAWWIENVHKEFMKGCMVFCYKPSTVGVKDNFVSIEKDMWLKMYPTRKIISGDVILDYLTIGMLEELH